mmetsp:Transcript_61351/g.197687  ORF Transcript_61351/g.197687 Transcript_61351/m.197687 type:complete len:201 (-) Transcript_61351:176-778(-)
MDREVRVVHAKPPLLLRGLPLALLGGREVGPALIAVLDVPNMQEVHPLAPLFLCGALLWLAAIHKLCHLLGLDRRLQDQPPALDADAEALHGRQLALVALPHHRRELLELPVCLCLRRQGRGTAIRVGKLDKRRPTVRLLPCWVLDKLYAGDPAKTSQAVAKILLSGVEGYVPQEDRAPIVHVVARLPELPVLLLFVLLL